MKKDTSATMRRRDFLASAVSTCVALSVSPALAKTVSTLSQTPVKIGVIADLHQDIMHDGMDRLRAFLTEMKKERPDALLQLGDFAYPSDKNKALIDAFNQSHETRLHVIGNHDTDSGHTKEQCVRYWGMPHRYYAQKINGIHIIVLDGNDTGSPTHTGGYPSYIGPEQTAWLAAKLEEIDGSIIIVSHQPIAGYSAIDNQEEIQSLLSKASDKILLAINGHSHINAMLRVKGITYLHINSASYFWTGDKYPHATYPQAILEKHKWIASTCPYKDSLFATLIIDPVTLTVTIKGRKTDWVGLSPAALGYNELPSLTIGEEIAPAINDRQVLKVKKVKG